MRAGGERRWMEAARRPWGRLLLVLVCYAALRPGLGPMALVFAAAVALASLWPRRRRSVLSGLAIAVCVVNIGPKWPWGATDPNATRLAMRALLVAGLWVGGLLAWTRLLASLPRWIERHSLTLLHLGAALFIGALWGTRAHSAMSGATAAALCSLVPELLWRSSYWMKWRARQAGPAGIWRNLFLTLPFLGSGGVPFGKGPAYIARYEARDGNELASAQLEGLRLLLLALAWRGVDALLGGLLWGSSSGWLPAWASFREPVLPTMEALLHTPDLFELWQRWAGLYSELIHAILTLAAYGHTIVGILCLMGIRIPRNTDAPLLSATILDFWNRYYFYFKELLMDFFFFPSFLRTPGMPVLWRTMLATVAAAFLGNVYYHLLMYSQKLCAGDVSAFLSLASARLVYCALLAGGLCFSFAGSLGKPAGPRKAGFPARLIRMAAVSTFFGVLHVWNYGSEDISLWQRLEFWKSLLTWN